MSYKFIQVERGGHFGRPPEVVYCCIDASRDGDFIVVYNIRVHIPHASMGEPSEDQKFSIVFQDFYSAFNRSHTRCCCYYYVCPIPSRKIKNLFFPVSAVGINCNFRPERNRLLQPAFNHVDYRDLTGADLF